MRGAPTTLSRSEAMAAFALDARCGTSRASSFNGAALRVNVARPVAPCHAGSSLLVEAAATKAIKAETLQRISAKLVPETVFVAGVNFKGLTVKDFETFRSKLPAGTELFVAKNTLVKKAIAGTPYEALGSACVGPNAFLFSGEDVASSIKAFNDMAKVVKKARNMELTWNGGVMDGKFIAPKDIGKLESLPTKKELIGQIARAVKQVTTKVARGVNGVSLKLAYGTKAIADGKSELIKA